jgi:ABC-type Zn uptake system ZnuABC Zn-binding protein ZnuA
VTRVLALCGVVWAAALGAGAFAHGSHAPAGRFVVVATTPQVAELVRSVAGPQVGVARLLAPNVDPHEHELRAGDVAAVDRARLVVRSGGDVDAWLDAALGGRRTLVLLDHVHRLGDDPHWWQDPRDAILAVGAIRTALASVDPAGASGYLARARAEQRRLAALDAGIARCWAAVAPSRRALVTSHDAYGYYARRYGIRILGAAIPSLSTAGQPSAGQLQRLVTVIRRARVRAIFSERAVNPRLAEAIASAAGARVGPRLYGDTLGPGVGYLDALRSDTRAIVSGLTGSGGCRP